jgi:LysM repeat protein
MKKSGWIPAVIGAALFMSACGDAATATTSTVATIGSTNYHTIPPTLSTLAPTTTAAGAPNPGPPAGTVTTDVTEYTIKANDVPFTVADKFGITVDALALANADTQGYSAFYVGLKIKIPAGAVIPDESATTTTAAGTNDTTASGETTTTLAGGGSNCAQGSYTIQDGDLPGTVAKKFDVTVAQLDAANADTKGYKNFIVGVKIIIPAKEGCTG